MKLELTAIAWRKTDTGSGVTMRLEAIGADAPTPGAKTTWPAEPGTLRIAKWTHGPLLIQGRFRKLIDNTGQFPNEVWVFVPTELDTPILVKLLELGGHELDVTFEPAQKALV